MKLISVIVPVYKVEKYLDRCVNSIVNQSYSDLEIILVDDGSPDNCGNLCDEWAMKDNRIKVIHKRNGGLSDARNAGIKAATGQYIGFVDSDDWIQIDMYKDLLEAIERDNTELAVTGIVRIYENNYTHKQCVSDHEYIIENDEIIRQYLEQKTFSTAAWDKLYLSSLFENRRFPVGKQYEDAPVIFDILCSINKLSIVGKPQYYYFQRADSICGQDFSISKMDHYYFSKDIRDTVIEKYPQMSYEANVFWVSKLCEIIYTLAESNNRQLFASELMILTKELRKGLMSVNVIASRLPLVMKFKTIFAGLGLTTMYVQIKKHFLKRA